MTNFSDVGGPFNGAVVPLVSGEPLWWVIHVDSNISADFGLFHKDPPNTMWIVIDKGELNTGSNARHVDVPLESLKGDFIGWRLRCAPLNNGTWPIYVQMFQGTDATGYKPVTRIAQYDVKLDGGAVIVSDNVQISA